MGRSKTIGCKHTHLYTYILVFNIIIYTLNKPFDLRLPERSRIYHNKIFNYIASVISFFIIVQFEI